MTPNPVKISTFIVVEVKWTLKSAVQALYIATGISLPHESDAT